jgi:hypothetical protein
VIPEPELGHLVEIDGRIQAWVAWPPGEWGRAPANAVWLDECAWRGGRWVKPPEPIEPPAPATFQRQVLP